MLFFLLLVVYFARGSVIPESAHNECAVEKFSSSFDAEAFVVLTNLPVIVGVGEWQESHARDAFAVRVKTTCTKEKSPLAWAALQAAELVEKPLANLTDAQGSGLLATPFAGLPDYVRSTDNIKRFGTSYHEFVVQNLSSLPVSAAVARELLAGEEQQATTQAALDSFGLPWNCFSLSSFTSPRAPTSSTLLRVSSTLLMLLVGVATACGRGRTALLLVALLAIVWSGSSAPLAEDEPCESVLEILAQGDGTSCDMSTRSGGSALIAVRVGDGTYVNRLIRPAGPCVDGRPFVDSQGKTVQSEAMFGEESLWNCQEEEEENEKNAEKAKKWIAQGLAEHASVASFAAFSLQLMVNGAPATLLRESALAARDEVDHAQLSFAIASRYSGQSVAPSTFPKHSVDGLKSQTKEEMIKATFEEGCLGETMSVLRAATDFDQLPEDVQTNAVAKRSDFKTAKFESVVDQEAVALLTIVQDELRHAVLAWKTVEWGVFNNVDLQNQLFADVQLREPTLAPLGKRVLFANRDTNSIDSPVVPMDFEQWTPGTLRAMALQSLIDSME